VTGSDLLSALGPVVEALEALAVRFYVAGSVASSVHGLPRTSIDADVVADLRGAPVLPLHDLPDARRFPVASAEDTVLAKLEWFRAGGEVSDRQWTDVVGVLKAKGPELDEAYLRRWAASLGIGELLDRALAEREGRQG
jgi:hypothetical protein